MATQAIAAAAIGGLGRDTDWIEDHNTRLLAAQRRGRRGPTPEALFPKRIDNSRLVKADDPARVREMRMFAYAMAFLLSLAMLYGWQHLSAIECGYRIETEKQQMQQLEEQNRQLRLSEAQLGDPERIDVMARQLGLTTPRPEQIVRPDATPDPNAPALAEATPAFPIAIR
jgi:cell division protein FtsL